MDRRSFLIGSGVLVAGDPAAKELKDGGKLADPKAGNGIVGDNANEASFREASFTTPQTFGAVGDGVANDTAAWSRFREAGGFKFIPAGDYVIDGEKKVSIKGVIGDGDVTTKLNRDQLKKINVGLGNVNSVNARLQFQDFHQDENIYPSLYISNSIQDDSGAEPETKIAGIYSYMEQIGSNTKQYVKSICGVSVNAASGNNDSTGVVGYTYKLNVEGGIGDAAGAGGAAWQYSAMEGLVLGGEFSAHQNVPGTYAANFAKRGNNTMSLHVSTNSTGARCFAGISLDTFGRSEGRYGFWNAILVNSSCFAASGASEVGTVGINFGNNTSIYPDKAVYLGNANYHLYRDNASIRAHGSSFDLENTKNGSVGIRLVTPTDNPQATYFGSYRGRVGHDGSTSLAPAGSFTIDGTGYTYLTSYRGSESVYSRAGCSPVSDAFVPLSSDGSGSMSLGTSSRLWSQVFAASGTISTSDERCKTDVCGFPEEVLDAWGKVNFAQFRFTDAVRAKGREARIHSGLLAQKIVEAFASMELDASRYGLLCYDKWEAIPALEQIDRVLVKPAVVDDNGNVIEHEEYQEVRSIEPGTPAGDRYGVRYEEALCLEAAYQRRRADKVERRLAALEAKLAQIIDGSGVGAHL